MDYEARKRVIWKEVLQSMQSLFNAPRHLQPDNMKEGRAAYLEALFEAVNSQLSNDMQEEDFTYYCKQISKDMIQSTTIRTWYMPNDLRKCALKHGQIWIGKQAHLASYENPTKPKDTNVDKSNPEGFLTSFLSNIILLRFAFILIPTSTFMLIKSSRENNKFIFHNPFFKLPNLRQ